MSAPAKLPGKQSRHLRALAHSLKPVVQVGKNGFTAALKEQIDGALLDHELIKVRVGSESPVKAKELAELMARELSASVAQIVGLIVVLYRAHPKKPVIKLPRIKTEPNEEA
jgi:RNA-binding protein